MPERLNGMSRYLDENGEICELDEQFFAEAKRGRPPLPADQKKQQVTMLLDPDVIAYFKKDGKGWQTRINAKLREIAGL